MFLLVVRFSCLGRDHIFTSRQAGIRDKRGRDNESQLYISEFSDGCNTTQISYAYTLLLATEHLLHNNALSVTIHKIGRQINKSTLTNLHSYW